MSTTPTPLSGLSIQEQINSLAARLAALDGIGLVAPSGQPTPQGQMANILAQIEGLKKTLGNVNMGYQSGIGSVKSDFQAFRQAVATILNLPQS